MKSQNIIGNASLHTTLIPVEKGMSHDCTKIAGQLQIFLALLETAYACAAEDKFDRFLKAFAEEVDMYMDDLIESLMPPFIVVDMSDEIPPEIVEEMEECMEKMEKRRRKK